MKTPAVILALSAICMLMPACAVNPNDQPRSALLPVSARIGLACRQIRSTRITRPETHAEAAENGLRNSAPILSDPHVAAYGLVLVPLATAIAASRGVAEERLHAAIPVVESAAKSSNWLRHFEREMQRAARERAGRALTLARVPETGLIHPGWKARYDAVLTVDFQAPSLRGPDTINPTLWAETSVYWSLIDTRTGKAIAGGPATAHAPQGHKFLRWGADGGHNLRRALAEATQLTADTVASDAFPAGVP